MQTQNLMYGGMRYIVCGVQNWGLIRTYYVARENLSQHLVREALYIYSSTTGLVGGTVDGSSDARDFPLK